MNLKAQGDTCYRTRDYTGALRAYQSALETMHRRKYDSSTPSTTSRKEKQTVLSNNVAVRLKLGQYADAVVDAKRCIACDPLWIKGYIRLAEAHRANGCDGLALDVLNDEVLAMDPNNKTADRMIEEILEHTMEHMSPATTTKDNNNNNNNVTTTFPLKGSNCNLPICQFLRGLAALFLLIVYMILHFVGNR